MHKKSPILVRFLILWVAILGLHTSVFSQTYPKNDIDGVVNSKDKES